MDLRWQPLRSRVTTMMTSTEKARVDDIDRTDEVVDDLDDCRIMMMLYERGRDERECVGIRICPLAPYLINPLAQHGYRPRNSNNDITTLMRYNF